MANKRKVSDIGRRTLAIFMVFVMAISLMNLTVFATGTAEDPYDIGDVVTVEGSDEPTGVIPDGAHWEILSTAEATYSDEASCGIEAHDHADECYNLDCTVSEHSHSTAEGGCRALTCDKEEHTHGRNCRRCTKEEHSHGDECYAQCEITEHTHSELDGDCYSLICEAPVHAHETGTCYQQISGATTTWTLMEEGTSLYDTAVEYILINFNGSRLYYEYSTSHTWLIQGTYEVDLEVTEDNMFVYTVGKQSGSIQLPVPEGFSVGTPTINYNLSVNSQNASYDCIVIDIYVDKIQDESGTVYSTGTADLAVTKTVSGLEGASLAGYEFALIDSEGNTVETAVSDDNGNVSFTALGFDNPGEYVYTIKEIAPDPVPEGWTYDDHELTVTVSVVAGSTTNGITVLYTAVTYGASTVFTNVYEEVYEPVHTLGSITVSKVNEGNTAPADTFFQLQKLNAEGQWENLAGVTYADFVGGSYTFTGLEEGEYRIVESGAEIEGWTLSVSSGTAVLTKTTAENGDTDVADGRIIITNTYEEIYVPVHTLGSLTVSKVSEGNLVPETALFQLEKLENGQWAAVGSAVPYSDFVDGSYTFTGLEEGEYRVVESGAAIEGWTLEVNDGGTAVLTKTTAENGDTDVTDGSITIVNTYEEIYVPVHTLGSLTVTKISLGHLVPDTALFQLQKLNAADQWETIESVTYGDFNGSSYTFTELEEGTYRVVESDAEIEGWTLDVSEGGTVVLTKTTAENGDTDVSDGSLMITNEYEEIYIPVHTLGSLTVTKVNEGNTAPADTFFQLQKLENGQWVNLAGVTYADFVGGSYTFTELEEGEYRIVESGAEIEGWTLSVIDGGTAVLTKTTADNGDTDVSDVTVTVTNTYEEIYVPVHTLGSLTVTKISEGNAVPASALFQLEKLENGKWVAVGSAVAYSAFVGGSYTFTELGEGTYRVVESGAAIEGWTLEVSSSGETTLEKTTADNGDTDVADGSIVITNTYEEIYVPVHTLGSLTVSKVNEGNTAPASAVFQLQKLNAEGQWENLASVTYEEFVDGSYTFTGLEAGEYRVSESGAAIEGWNLQVSDGGTMVLEKTTAENGDTDVSDGSITIVNIYEEIYVPVHTLGSITVTKITEGNTVPADALFQLEKLENGFWIAAGSAVPYSDFVNGSYTFDNLGAGTYRVTESGAAIEGWTLEVDNSGEIVLTKTTAENGDTDVSDGSITITNTYEEIYVPVHTLGSITVTKIAEGNTVPADALFQLQKLNAEGQWETVASVTYGDFTGGSYTFTDLDEGTYRVTESGAEIEGWTLEVDNSGETVLTKTTAANGDTDVSDGEIVITNTYEEIYVPVHTLGSITVTKIAEGNTVPADALFQLQKYENGQWAAVGSAVPYSAFVGGSYTFTYLEEGEYRITESGAAIEGWTLEVSDSGTVTLEKTTAANGDTDVADGRIVITNIYEEIYVPVHTPGAIVLTKISSGNETPAEALFQLQKLEGENWVNHGEPVAYSRFENGVYVFTGLEAGTYRVLESGAEIEGWTLMVSDSSEVVLTESEAENGDTTVNQGRVDIVNVYEEIYVPVHTPGSLTVTKVSSGRETPADALFQLQKLEGEEWINIGSAVPYADFTGGSYTFTGLEEGTYRVTESGAAIEGWTLEVSDSGETTLTKTTADNGDTDVSDGEITVTNTYEEIYVPVHTPGAIVLTKISSGNETPAEAIFQLQKLEGENWVNLGEPVAYSRFENGVYVFTGLEAGTYRVLESGAEIEGWTLSVSNSSEVELTQSEAENGDTTVNQGKIDIVNVYEEIYVPVHTPGEIVLTKVTNGAETPADTLFQLQKLEGEEWVNIGSAVSYSQFENGVYVFGGLEAGTYRVVESGAAIEGYELEVSDSGETVLTLEEYANGDTAVSTGMAEIVNVYTEIKKPVEGEIPGDEPPPENPPADPPAEDPPAEDVPGDEPPAEDVPGDEPPAVDIPDEDVPLVDIPDEDVPLSDIPKTGDDSIIYILMAVLSGGCLLWLALSGRKAKKEND